MSDYHQPIAAAADRQHGEEPLCELPHSPSREVVHPGTLSVEKAQRMSEFLGFLADTNRLRIIALLASGEMCVGDLAAALVMNESAVSHQLRTLRAIRLVDFRKQGRHVFYRLEDDHVLNFYYSVLEHIDETAG
jgi:ArsR family transcriptional regulator, lead/cadmium/zinc/bismuth-responsive transcriptional repressor